tara:strand:- start:71 stop:334 length:264 start_codon:yes stop_codon:yes gene_type:complete
MFNCQLCSHSEEYLYINKYCDKCKKIKHYLSIYEDRVYEILDNVLSRDLDKQNNKIKLEINNEINNQTEKLNNSDESYIKPKTRTSK